MNVLLRGAVFLAVLVPCQAAADAPPGTYNLKAVGSFTHGTVEGKPVPSCGLSAEKMLGSQKQLSVRYAKLVTVDTTVWTFLGAYSSMAGRGIRSQTQLLRLRFGSGKTAEQQRRY